MVADAGAVKLGVAVSAPVNTTAPVVTSAALAAQLATSVHSQSRFAPQGVVDCGLPSSAIKVDTVPVTSCGSMSASMAGLMAIVRLFPSSRNSIAVKGSKNPFGNAVRAVSEMVSLLTRGEFANRSPGTVASSALSVIETVVRWGFSTKNLAGMATNAFKLVSDTVFRFHIPVRSPAGTALSAGSKTIATDFRRAVRRNRRLPRLDRFL